MKNRLFAIGDVHGCLDKLRSLLEDRILLTKEDQLVLLGDYIDRGPQSRQVLDYIISLQLKGFNLTPLLGNHEAMLLDAYKDHRLFSKWIYNGGYATLESFEIHSLRDMDRKYIGFFKSLLIYYSHEDFLFVHAGFNDEAVDPFEDKYHMLWRSRTNYSHPALVHKTIVHGHSTITLDECRQNIFTNKPVLNMDTGCVFSKQMGYGKLTAIELNSRIIMSV